MVSRFGIRSVRSSTELAKERMVWGDVRAQASCKGIWMEDCPQDCLGEVCICMLEGIERDSSVRINTSGDRRIKHSSKDQRIESPNGLGGFILVMSKFARATGVGGKFD